VKRRLRPLFIFSRNRIPAERAHDVTRPPPVGKQRSAACTDSNAQCRDVEATTDQVRNDRIASPLQDRTDAKHDDTVSLRGTFAAKNTQLRDRIARLPINIEACDSNRSDEAAQVEKVFELEQTSKGK
jgi:hypothetical protein